MGPITPVEPDGNGDTTEPGAGCRAASLCHNTPALAANAIGAYMCPAVTVGSAITRTSIFVSGSVTQ